MADNLPEWKPGLPVLAAWLKAMVDAIRANRVIVDSSGGLIPLQTPNGLKLSFRPPPDRRYAIITTDCPAATVSSGVVTLGKGAGTIYSLAYSTTGVATLASSGTTGVAIYNPGNEAVVAGKRVWVVREQGQWHLNNTFC